MKNKSTLVYTILAILVVSLSGISIYLYLQSKDLEQQNEDLSIQAVTNKANAEVCEEELSTRYEESYQLDTEAWEMTEFDIVVDGLVSWSEPDAGTELISKRSVKTISPDNVDIEVVNEDGGVDAENEETYTIVRYEGEPLLSFKTVGDYHNNPYSYSYIDLADQINNPEINTLHRIRAKNIDGETSVLYSTKVNFDEVCFELEPPCAWNGVAIDGNEPNTTVVFIVEYLGSAYNQEIADEIMRNFTNAD